MSSVSGPNRDQETLCTLLTVLELKDPFLKMQAEKVAATSVLLARDLGLSQPTIKSIYLAAIFRDVGLVYIPDELVKEDLINTTDGGVQEHPLITEKILQNLSHVQECLPFIRHHHEAFDGTGYPDHLKGDAIPLGSRIIRLAETWWSLRAPREGDGLDEKGALAHMQNGISCQFDPRLLDRFVAMIEGPADVKETDFSFISTAVCEISKRFKGGNINLPVMPSIIKSVQDVIDSPSASAETLAKVLEQDSVISMSLIAVANSPAYRGSEEFKSVRQAIPRLGLKETQMIVNAIAQKSLYESGNKMMQKTMEQCWLHSLAVACAAKQLAEEMRMADPERYFTLGMMHDVGKVLLLHAGEEILRHAQANNQINDISEIDMAEVAEAIKVHHPTFGAALLKRWKFSDDFTQVAQNHGGHAFDSNTDKSILIVHLANIISRIVGYSQYEHAADDVKGLISVRLLGLEREVVDRVVVKTKEFMRESAQAFG